MEGDWTRFKKPEEIKQVFKAAGVDLEALPKTKRVRRERKRRPPCAFIPNDVLRYQPPTHSSFASLSRTTLPPSHPPIHPSRSSPPAARASRPPPFPLPWYWQAGTSPRRLCTTAPTQNVSRWCFGGGGGVSDTCSAVCGRLACVVDLRFAYPHTHKHTLLQIRGLTAGPATGALGSSGISVLTKRSKRNRERDYRAKGRTTDVVVYRSFFCT